MSDKPIVWITQDDAQDLGIKNTEIPCRVMDIADLVYELLKHGSPRDIVVLPYYWNFQDTVTHIRNRGITGPIIIYSISEIKQMDTLDFASRGILLLDSSKGPKADALSFILFLQKCQEWSQAQPVPHKQEPAAPNTKPSHDKEEIKALFRDIMRNRSRILFSCQFNDDFPTLTVTGEIIQMVGDIEPKLVLDNFRPEEFVDLYSQMGMGRPMSGFFTQQEDTMGFEVRVDTVCSQRITVFLPESVYEQKRQFIRVEPSQKDPVILHILPDDHQTLRIPVSDISEGGVGLVLPYDGLQKKKSYEVCLTLPAHPALPNAVMDSTQIFPVEPGPSSQTLIGTAEVIFKEEKPNSTYVYGLSIRLHPADVQYLQHYVFKRQLEILANLRKMTI